MRNLFPQSPLRQWRGSSGSFFFSSSFLHYWPSLCVRLPLPVFSITVPFCHRQGSECPLSLWPSITQHNHLRQVLRYSNKPSPDAAEAASLLKHLWELWNDWTRCWSGAVTTVDCRLSSARRKRTFFLLLFFLQHRSSLCANCINHVRFAECLPLPKKKKKKNCVRVYCHNLCSNHARTES